VNNHELVKFLDGHAIYTRNFVSSSDAHVLRLCAQALRDAQGEREVLELILPLAKGYAADHPVGSNHSYIEIAERALLTNKPEAEPTNTPSPYPNCSFLYCDLPGQCKSEGKCHHPKPTKPVGDRGIE
jgi:hypothetical protein